MSVYIWVGVVYIGQGSKDKKEITEGILSINAFHDVITL